MKVILIRYSEIHLKGNNRYFFENLLVKNVRSNLKGFDFKLVKSSSRYIISDYDVTQTAEMVNRVKSTFGVHSVSVAEVVDSDFEKIATVALQLAPKTGTFKVVANRADKRFPLNSMEICSELGGRILDANPQLAVDIHNPENVVQIDIREDGKTYVFSEIEKALSGMPVGSGGRAMVLLSGGIDSPVATYMMAKRGMSLRAVHFHSYPYTSVQAKDKVLSLAKIVKKYTIGMTVDVVSFTEIQTAIHEKCPEEFLISIMRRFMMRIANSLCVRHKCGGIVTGESLGQVASQTLESITSTNSVAAFPVLRPLIGMNKDEIVEIAKSIGTFETSILPYEDCCTIFLPKNPVIRPKLDVVERIEQSLDIDTLVNNALNNIETVVV
jgi:thiamine biosynthesis protein ThiI